MASVFADMTGLESETFPYKDFTIGIIVVIEAFEQYLALRQRRKLALKTLPKVLQGSVDEDTFAKSRAYTLDKSRFHVVESVFAVTESILVSIPFALAGPVLCMLEDGIPLLLILPMLAAREILSCLVRYSSSTSTFILGYGTAQSGF